MKEITKKSLHLKKVKMSMCISHDSSLLMMIQKGERPTHYEGAKKANVEFTSSCAHIIIALVVNDLLYVCNGGLRETILLELR